MNNKTKYSAGFSLGLYVLTFVWLLSGTFFIVCHWPKVSTLEPNALGDMLAGFFAPLAFLWLVAGYLQQGRELKQNTTALMLQHEELIESVEQQRQLALAANQDMELFRQQIKDQTYKDNNAAQPLFDISVREITADVSSSKSKYTLHNLGHIVSEVTIQVDGAELQGDGFLGILEPNNPAVFTIVFNDKSNSTELTINYLDGLRIRRLNRFRKMNGGGRNWLLVEGWNGKAI